MIPEEAVDAAAFELYKDDHWGKPTEWPTGPLSDGETLEEFKFDYLRIARATLQAAAPIILSNEADRARLERIESPWGNR